ncbi:putative sam dependent protein [Ilyonectria robusta]
MADEYPSAEVLGFDISAVQPSWVPPNCSFQIDDAQLDWTFKGDEFDFIHMRYLYGGIDDWSKLYRQAFRHVKPGGWVENTEIDLETRSENPKVSGDEGHIFKEWRNLFWEAGEKINRTFKIARDNQMEQKMREAGFVDIQHHQWKVPIGGWPRDPKLKQIGLYNGMFIDQSLDGFAVFPIGEILGWTFDEVTVLTTSIFSSLIPSIYMLTLEIGTPSLAAGQRLRPPPLTKTIWRMSDVVSQGETLVGSAFGGRIIDYALGGNIDHEIVGLTRKKRHPTKNE